MRTLGPPAVLGDMALSEGTAASRRVATVVATTPVTTLVVPRATFSSILRARRAADVRAKLALFKHVEALAGLPAAAQEAVAVAMQLESFVTGASPSRSSVFKFLLFNLFISRHRNLSV